MANQVMQSGAYRLLGGATGAIAYLTDTIKIALVGAGYVQNADDVFIDTGGANDVVDHRIAGTTDQTLANKAMAVDNTGNFVYLDADDPVFASVPAGPAVAKVVVYKDTGTPTTSPILCVLEVTVTPNGGNITIQFATPANGGIMKQAA